MNASISDGVTSISMSQVTDPTLLRVFFGEAFVLLEEEGEVGVLGTFLISWKTGVTGLLCLARDSKLSVPEEPSSVVVTTFFLDLHCLPDVPRCSF